jgi:hypothetical protein
MKNVTTHSYNIVYYLSSFNLAPFIVYFLRRYNYHRPTSFLHSDMMTH